MGENEINNVENMKKVLLFLNLLLISFELYADDIRKVGGVFPYYADVSMSISEAKLAAIENAKLQAIAKEFGTTITQNVEQIDQAINNEENTFFMQYTSSEVMGEWIEDLKEPICEVEEVNSDVILLRATVFGRARALSNEAVDFEACILRNGTEKRYADTRFRTGDDMYVYFRTPVDGYVCVYLIDEQPMSYCLLPYLNDNDGIHTVKKNKEYVFFSCEKQNKNEKVEVDELNITCSNENGERNQIYVVFSPEPFTKAIDEHLSETLPRQLVYQDFTRWLGKCRRRDPKMGVKIMKIKITN